MISTDQSDDKNQLTPNRAQTLELETTERNQTCLSTNL